MCKELKKGLELTLAILKPNVASIQYIVEDIRRRILDNNFLVLRSKRARLTLQEAEEFYAEHKGKFFYNRLVLFMSSGPCYFHILAREHAIETWRAMMGPTKVHQTVYSHPSTIRGTYGLSDTRNVTHGSDSQKSAEREIQFFFPDFKLTEWYESTMKKYINGDHKFDPIQFVHITS